MLFTVVLLSVVAISFGIYQEYSTNNTAPYARLLISSFGMASGGKIEVTYSVAPSSAGDYNSYNVIVVATEAAKHGWFDYFSNGDTTEFDSESVSILCNQPSLYRTVVFGEGTITYTVTEAAERYSLYLMQCISSVNNPITAKYKVSMYNLRPKDNFQPTLFNYFNDDNSLLYGAEAEKLVSDVHISHLDIADAMLPRMYSGLLSLHILLLLGILGQLYLASDYSGMQWIHYVLLMTSLSYVFALYLQLNMEYVYNKQGFTSLGDEVTTDIFIHIFSCFFLFAMLSVSQGWGLLRPYLTERELQLTVSAMSLYGLTGLIGSVCFAYNNTESFGCAASISISFLVKIGIYLASILGMNYNVTHLRVQALNSPWSPSTPILLARAKAYSIFRWVYLGFLIMPIINAVIMDTTVSWENDWVSDLLEEFLILAVFIHVAVTFGPIDMNILTRPFDARHFNVHGE